MYSEEEYYHKADNLIRISCQAVQSVFRDRWKRLTGKEWTEESAQEFIKGEGKAFYSSSKSIQKRLLRQGNLEEWDLTLLSGVLRSLNSTSTENAELRKSDQLALQEICSERNKLAHNAQKKITAANYQDAENTIRRCLSTLGVNPKKIDKLIAHAGVTSSVAALEQAKKIQIEGDKAFLRKNYLESIKLYEEALLVPSLLPVNLCTLYEKKAKCYLALGKREKEQKTKEAYYNQAMTDISQALEHNESSWQAHAIIGRVYKAKNELEKAIEHFTQALAISPGQSDLKVELDDCKLLNGQMTREEHMDPLKMPTSLEEITEHYSKASGIKMTPEMFLKSQQQGDKLLPGHSDVQTGHRYANGWKAQQNYQEAARHYTKAMKKGNAEGIYNLAILYTDGKGVQRDVLYAIELLKRAANMPEKIKVFGSWHVDVGVREAQHSLGLRYDEGIGVAQDFTQAVHWYSKAANNGSGNAANNLGISYYNGKGVAKDLKMAEMCWKKAVENGNCNAAFSLYSYYVDEYEPKLAQQYLDKAIKLGHNRLPYMKKEMEEKIKIVAELRKELDNFLVKFEKENGFTPGGLTARQRQNRFLETKMHEKASTNDEKEAAERFAEYQRNNPFSYFHTQLKSHRFSNDNNISWAGRLNEENLDIEEIGKLANAGSATAHRIMAVSGYYVYFAQLWNKGPPFSEQRAKNIVHFVYLRCCLEHHIIFEKPEVFMELLKFLTSMLEKHCSQECDLDKKVRLCYAFYVKDKGSQFRIQVIKEGIRRYPNEAMYYNLLSCIYCDMKEHGLALEVINNGLQRFPNWYELLYDKAVNLRLTQSFSNRSGEEVRNAYLNFIRFAPEDHRKVPEAYYCVATSYVTERYNLEKLDLDAETKKKVVEYYEKGKQSEKIQLPCYLPYESTTKVSLEPLMIGRQSKTVTGDGNKNSDKRENNPVKSSPLPKIYLKDPKRIEVIKAHRQSQKSLRDAFNEMKKRNGIPGKISNTAIPTLHQTLPEGLRNLEEITLQEMDPTEDTIYKNKFLNLTLIEDPIFGLPSIHLVATDDNKEVTRLYVYNVPQNEEMRGKLRFGCRMSIINPYRRQCRDWKNAIRIDEPKCIVYLESVEKMCRYCNEPNAQHNCKKCKWARYCSRECQVADWKELDHKLICNLKRFTRI